MKVLIVDDNPGNLLSLKTILEPMGLIVITASSGNEALKVLIKERFSLILLDVEMPLMSGFEVAELMTQLDETKYTPIIFITAHLSDHGKLTRGYEAGAVDYISKPFNPETLKSKVRVFLRLYEQTEELVKKQNDLQDLVSAKQKMISQIEEQNKKKDILLNQINEQNGKIQKLSRFKKTMGSLLLSFVMLFLLFVTVNNRQLTKQTEELQNANNLITNLNTSYQRFIPYDTLNLIGKKSIMEVELGDQVLKNLTVMFVDTRGYSSIAENLSPNENLKLLNEIFAILQSPIEKHKGIVDKHLGDGLMALFPNGADDAVAAAIEMINDLSVYSKNRILKNQIPIKVGIGIDGGEMMLGTVGNKNRMEQTVVADAVNVASRLEGMTKMYGASILVSEYIFQNLQNPDHYFIRYMDRVLVKGRKKPVTVYQVMDGENDLALEKYKSTIDDFAKGVILFNEGNFKEALLAFENVTSVNEQDAAALSYIERCKQNMENIHNKEVIRKLETK